MAEEMQPREAGTQAGLPLPGPDIIAGAEQPPIPNATWLDESLGFAAHDESDPIEVELAAKLEALLAQDVALSASYKEKLGGRRQTWPEVRRMRAELRRLHTEEGAILFEIKLHMARKGRAGRWAEFLRETKPKPLSRTTTDRWIKWYLDSQKQAQSPQPSPEQKEENAPQNKSGAFSADTQPQPSDGASDQPPTVTTDRLPTDATRTFEDLRQVILLLTESEAAQLKAAGGFLAAKIGSVTYHQAIYLTVVEAAEQLGFVYPMTGTEEVNIDDAKERDTPGSETPTARSQAA